MDKHAEKNMKKYVDKYVKSHTVVHRKGSMIFAIASSAIAASGITCGAIFIPKALANSGYNGPKIQEKEVNHSVELETQSDSYQLYTFSIDSDKVTSENLSCFVQTTESSRIQIANEASVIVSNKNIYTYINYDSTFAEYGDTAKFNLVFAYSDNETSLTQSFTNFELKYNQEIGDAELAKDVYCYAGRTTQRLIFKNNKNLEVDKLRTEKHIEKEGTKTVINSISDPLVDGDVPEGYFAIDINFTSSLEGEDEDDTIEYNLYINDEDSNKIWTFNNLTLTATLKGILPETKSIKTPNLSFDLKVDLPEFDFDNNEISFSIKNQNPIGDFVDGQIEVLKCTQPSANNLCSIISFDFVNNNVVQFAGLKFDLVATIKKISTSDIVAQQTFEKMSVRYLGPAFKQELGNPNLKEFDVYPVTTGCTGFAEYIFKMNLGLGDLTTSEQRVTYLNNNLIFESELYNQNNFIPIVTEYKIMSSVNSSTFDLTVSFRAEPTEIKKLLNTSGTANLYMVIGFKGDSERQLPAFRTCFTDYKLKVNYKAS